MNKKAIDLSDISSWPRSIFKEIERNSEYLRNFITEDKKPTHCTIVRDPIINLLKDRFIVGYHATRLSEQEVRRIKREGLKPLSKEFLNEKISNAVSDGLISKEEGCLLKHQNSTNEENRTNKIWFAFNHEHLKEESDFGALFNMWGGESLYTNHDQGEGKHVTLSRIGMPYIIKARIPVADLEQRSSDLAERFIDCYLRIKGWPYRAEYDSYCDYISSPVPADEILGMLSQKSACFESLTEYTKWNLKAYSENGAGREI